MIKEEKAFLEAIAREPDEDLHRLGYADWLTENGDPNRAELIRIQCGLERGVDWQTDKKATADRLKELQGRERELIEGMRCPKKGEPGIREFGTTPEIAAIAADPDRIIFRRGMIDYLSLAFTRIAKLPPGLFVGGTLTLSSARITELPPDLYVGGNLYLIDTPITSDAARRILTMPNLSREAKLTGLESTGRFPALAEQAHRLPETNAGPGTPPWP